MGKKSTSSPQQIQSQDPSLDEINEAAEKALTDLDASLTAAGAIVELTLSDGISISTKLLYKRLNSLEFLLRQAGTAEDIVWDAVNRFDMSSARG